MNREELKILSEPHQLTSTAKHPKPTGNGQWKKAETYALVTAVSRKDILSIQRNYLLRTTLQSKGGDANSIPCHPIPSPATFGKSLLYWPTRYPLPTLLPNPSSQFSLKLIATTSGGSFPLVPHSLFLGLRQPMPKLRFQGKPAAGTIGTVPFSFPMEGKSFLPALAKESLSVTKPYIILKDGPLQKLNFPSIYFQLSAVLQGNRDLSQSRTS